MRRQGYFRSVGVLIGACTALAMVLTAIVAAPGGAATPEKEYTTSFEMECVVAPGVLNIHAKEKLKVTLSATGPEEVQAGQEVSFHGAHSTIESPVELTESFVSLGANEVNGTATMFVLTSAGLEPTSLNIVKPAEFPSGLPFLAPVEKGKPSTFHIPSKTLGETGLTYSFGPQRITQTSGSVVVNVNDEPGYTETEPGVYKETGFGIVTEVEGRSSGAHVIGPLKTACNAPAGVVAAEIRNAGPCGLGGRTCTTTSTTTTTTAASASGTLDQEQSLESGEIGGTHSFAQTFTAGLTGRLTAVELIPVGLRKSLEVQIRNVEANGAPGTEVLAKQTLANLNIEWTPFVFESPAEVVRGTRYAIVTAPDFGGFRAEGGSPYARGELWQGPGPAGPWEPFFVSGWDIAFKTYVEPSLTTAEYKNWIVAGSITDKRLGQPIALPAGSTFNGSGEVNTETGAGSVKGNLSIPPFTSSLKLFGPLAVNVGLTLSATAPLEGAVAKSESVPGDETLFAPLKLNAAITSVGILGLTIPTTCATTEPLALNLTDTLTREELLTKGWSFAGMTAVPRVKCEGGFLSRLFGVILTGLLGGPEDPYSISITAPSG
jgi:hypothetical protein